MLVQHHVPRELKPGYSGRDVLVVQNALYRAHARRNKGTGHWFEPTTNQVRVFQRAHGLRPDGVIGEATWQRLYPYLTRAGRAYMRSLYTELHPPRPDWRTAAMQAAYHDYTLRDSIAYTQGPARWSGVEWILRNVGAVSRGAFPPPLIGDCSSKYAQWALWGFVRSTGVVPNDGVNGASWRGGFTGTMFSTMRRTNRPLPGDAVMYGAPSGRHTAMLISGGRCVSHGSSAGPYVLPVHYRGDFYAYRSPV